MTSSLARIFGHSPSTSPWKNRNAIREELFSIERLEEHAKSLAVAQIVFPHQTKGNALGGRLVRNGAVLFEAYKDMAVAIDEGHAITPAAEWLVDNYHLVEKQIHEIRTDLPAGYYRQLPKLATGPFAGYPRVFGMAWAFVAHTDSHFDGAMLDSFVRAYQQVQPLTIGELWAISLTLRIVLIENLRRVAEEVVDNRAARQRADRLASRVLGAGDRKPEPIPQLIAGHEEAILSDAFAVQLIHRLRDQDPKVTPALTWLDGCLAAQGTDADSIVREVHRSQGAANVTMRNIITSLRLINDVDWTELFEQVSLVDEVLAEGSVFREMDFPTRNLYRSAIEELARGSHHSELEIAHQALRAARENDASGPGQAAYRNDPGYYLMAGGRRAFEQTIGFRLPLRKWPRRFSTPYGVASYAAAIMVLSLFLLALPLVNFAAGGTTATAFLVLLGVLGTIPAIDTAVALVNRGVTMGFGAMPLPGLELRQGIPDRFRTLVAVPTLLVTPEAIAAQVERLEVHYLASEGGEVYFAILSDWVDAPTQRTAKDEALLSAAVAGIAALNRRYAADEATPRFMLLHRKRVWNDSEQCWMGWERKRGKLHELNRLLRGATDTTFTAPNAAAPHVPADIRYVITLDSDTQLPRDTVRRLIGKMAHPLNQPCFDASGKRVVDGYAILQPRITPSLPVGRQGSLFQHVFSSLSGIDPYAAAVSDVYQDLFGEGSYTGKGIYDVDAFEAALSGRVPDSTLLSHDLFEGVFARSGLASDIEVVEEFPARYDVGALRHHRWARGDWQLMPWILGTTPKQESVPSLGRWKMLDNLRRTLSAPMAILALFAGWTMPFHSAAVWTGFIMAVILTPALIPIVTAFPPFRRGVTLVSELRAFGCEVRLALILSLLIVVFLADEACLMGDAIVRTLWRLYVTRRHLLEWIPAAQASGTPRLDLAGFYRRMAGALVVSVVALILPEPAGFTSWPLILPFAALWLLSPAAARWISLPPHDAAQVPMTDADRQILRLTARRTWRFFETFVTAVDNMLPPDNFQEDPAPVLARRTSPTNMGLYLLSVVSARDMGWIGTSEMVERLEATLTTMSGLAKFRGHFYNWYDTNDLRALDPQYISSVDSGNLAGHLVALAQACQEYRNRLDGAVPDFTGIGDTIALARLDLARATETDTGLLDEALEALAASVRQSSRNSADLPRALTYLADQAERVNRIARAIVVNRSDPSAADLLYWVQACHAAIEAHRRDLQPQPAIDALKARLSTIEATARSLALDMEFGFLFDPERKLLSIGYLVPEATRDDNCYDLLASEARLASFIAIAKGDVPARHWFRLGRAVTPIARGAALVSWSGSMFEYLMPSLVMRAPDSTLLAETSRLIVRRQIEYATKLGLPWGISESAYNARDLEFTYQYSNFGVPGLGLKRGLGENHVVAPYATALAAMVYPRAASRNMTRLSGIGAQGRYGFYEALDYTRSRLPAGQDVAFVRAYMAHHQGMSIVAIADAVLDGTMRERFHTEPIIQATELLLQERPPREIAIVRPWLMEARLNGRVRDIEGPGGREFASPHQSTPATHLLSNGRYTTMITAAGSGYSRWGTIAITRWREDPTCDDYGSYIFVRDMRSGEVWSAGLQPTGREPDRYSVNFDEDRAAFARHDRNLATTMDVAISPEDDAEIRHLSITNTGNRACDCEITSYAELVLTRQADDIAHPAFAKMFVETEYLPDVGAILATRRRRTPDEPDIWVAHLSIVDGETVGKPQVETDRARFLGRGNGVRTPAMVIDGTPLSNTVGTVLDPIFALRRRVRIPAGATVRVDYWTMVATTRQDMLDAIDKHRDMAAYGRAAMLAWTQAQVQLYHLNITAGKAGLFQTLAGHVLYADSALRPSSGIIRNGAGPQSGLWAQGISGDLPIVLLRIADTDNLDIAHELLQAHEYWRMKQFPVDLVILNERQSSYIQDLQIAIETLARTSQARQRTGEHGPVGHVFVLRADLMPAETRSLLVSAARIVLVAQRGSLMDQLDRIARDVMPDRRYPKRRQWYPLAHAPAMAPAPDLPLEFFNGLGGFAEDGKEYVTVLGPGRATPAPWINVVSNPSFGFQVAAEGSGYTWSMNSRENQLTPWSNDPVSDRPGEVIYLRDDETGDLWTPTALPIRNATGTYIARHGRGYSRFQHTAHGIDSDLLQYVPMDDPVKISHLLLHNRTDRPRTFDVVAYVEWVLAPSRSASQAFIATEIDSATGAMFAQNKWTAAFGSRIAFLDMRGVQTDWTGNRRSFIGRDGTLASPAALAGQTLSRSVGASFDPCGVMLTTVRIPANGSAEVVVLLGQAANADEARSLILKYRTADLEAIQGAVTAYWNDFLGQVQVRTPDRAMDIMLNGWLLYQTLACRVWARSGFYQASGAYGFRDQLQDGMALTPARPALTRAHLLQAAARQFVEGDVQHWWLPHSGQGVRTRISDDRPWLAYTVAHYVEATGDVAVLDEPIPFLEGETLKDGETDNFFQPAIGDETGTLFEHCARALDHSLALGSHGLPLIGTGDWNDGMNRVGDQGKGESIWLGWFLHAALMAFVPLAIRRKEKARAVAWRKHADRLKVALEAEAWDGDWYRRGFFDDGTPLGSRASLECKIDSIAQSWAVISGAGSQTRAVHAMEEVEKTLIRPVDKLALLFAPPFDKTPLDPGYVKGYPPGLRENGGQYTHAALWSVIAFAMLGQGDKAADLFALLNPINHSLTPKDVVRYKVEPYVVAADIYATPPLVGRGGWTWYTGSAGWMQRAGIESILGLRLEGDTLHLAPCIPRAWPGFEISLRHGTARYEIVVTNPGGTGAGIAFAALDGNPVPARPLRVELLDDDASHRLDVRLGPNA